MEHTVRKFSVSGRVQGVFYRASTKEKAISLSLSGYAKNLPDGTVEVLVSGEDAAVKLLQAWLWLGPPAAQVKQVTEHSVMTHEMPPILGFTTA